MWVALSDERMGLSLTRVTFSTDQIENTVSINNPVVDAFLPIFCLETDCITSFYCCVPVYRGRYLATAAVYRVIA
jgi:hypothetical protein